MIFSLDFRPAAEDCCFVAFDVFFLSFDEPDREKNRLVLKKRFPLMRSLHGVCGIRTAHALCARLSRTPLFFVVNGDSEVLKTFGPPPPPLKNQVYVFRSRIPAVNLTYGFGAVKLFPKTAFRSVSAAPDMSSSLGVPYKIVPQTVSLSRFNSSPLMSFRGAFRECVKLASLCMPRQNPLESRERLAAFLNPRDENGKPPAFARYIALGARLGAEFGRRHRENPSALRRINDFRQMNRLFEEIASGAENPSGLKPSVPENPRAR